MSNPHIDPEWAWAPFEPDSSRPWTEAMAAHLYRRAGFGASRAELAEAVRFSPSEVVDQLVKPNASFDAFQRDSNQFAKTVLASGDPKQLSAWWVYTMLRSPHPLLENTTLFWHGHFATSAEKVQDANAMFNQNRLLREHALGDFSQLVHGISKDPAMLIYLDSVTNRKAHPNENYARELMELFCLGEGRYTENDVLQLARCFTGWEIRRGRFRFNRYQHDAGEKSILGTTGSFPDSSAVDLVLQKASAPRFIVGKLIRYFVMDEPHASSELIEPLAISLRDHEWDIGQTIATILRSNLFYSDLAVGRKIRSPIDLAIGLMRSLEGTTNAVQLASRLVDLGQGLFYPPNVKGWEGGRAWINSSTLLGRTNLVGELVRDEKTRFGGGSLEEYFNQLGADSPDQVVDTLASLILAAPPSDETRGELIRLLNTTDGDRNDRLIETVHALSTLPEFQLC